MRSAICRSDADSIRIHGLDLTTDILGKVDLGQMAFLEIWGRLPNPQEDAVFNALVVALVEHGLTPSVLAARLTYLGAPDSLQAAVAAGLSGVGTVFVGSIEGAARLLQEAKPADASEEQLQALARDIVARFRAEKRIIPGLGHPIHKQTDPRTACLLAIAAENGFRGNHVRLLELVAAEAERSLERHLPINVSGAIGAIASELGMDWRVCRGIGLIARTIGLVAHLLEEIRSPLARELWLRTEHEAQEAP
ncbi:citryl-CoA lyase [Azospirillum canadense]|uniref:citryl-CoA lyase n=1 Tax=Azospirillum canadense TaxID=403962 RepID=UPI0022277D93|nr:citryl-CoA lyase [Azospirillum canadense]MCW2241281.1 citrate synthase [Azospirillum canadense]